MNSVGEVVLFLDAHCEANQGWLPPLLERIALDHRTAVCPTIDFIDHNTFEYKPMDPYIRGTFNWRFDYKERPVRPEDMKKRKDPTQEVKYVYFKVLHKSKLCSSRKHPYSSSWKVFGFALPSPQEILVYFHASLLKI